MKTCKLTHERLCAVLRYDPGTGAFENRSWRPGCTHGKCGAVRDRYLRIRIDGELHYAHRLAWFYVHKVWPPQHLDHVNRDTLDNRIENLRLATASQNGANQKCQGKVGLKGVTAHQGKFMAQLMYRRKQHYLGVYDSAEEAHAAYCRKAEELQGEYHAP